MTELQYLSHAEQMEAHRQTFNAWWRREIEPLIPRELPKRKLQEIQCLSQIEHWKAYRAKHHLNPK